jgi:3',5'-cyclic AMP phosphodiesterase CpdA
VAMPFRSRGVGLTVSLSAVCLVALVALLPRDVHALTLTRYPSIWLRTEASVTIAWQTDTSAPGKVLYGLTPDLGTEVSAPGIARDQSVSLVCESPGSRYYYRVVSGTDTLNAAGDFFETAPSTIGPFRFLAFGDIGRATTEQIQVASRVEQLDPDLAILTGDIIYEAGEAQNFTPQYFDIYRSTIARVPFYPSLGNHDIGTSFGQPYLDAFYLPPGPGNERYYSFDYSNAHFACIEVVAENQAPNAAMLAWLDADLAATGKTWKFVFFHIPMYSNPGGHGGDPSIAAALDPILSFRGVDLVFQGHNHFYTRTYPIVGGAVVGAAQNPNYVNPPGPIYIVTGGGGRSLYALGPALAYEAISRSTYHVTSVDVDQNRLILTAVERDGTVVDMMTVTKAVATAVDLPPESGARTAVRVSASPNPSSGEIRFRFSGAAPIRVLLYDVGGRLVREIGSTAGQGPNTIAWDGQDQKGRAVPAGLYIARVEAGDRAATIKLIRLRGR